MQKMNENEVAEFLCVSERTLINWRLSGQGPRYYKPQQKVYYFKEDLIEWIKSHGEAALHSVRSVSIGDVLLFANGQKAKVTNVNIGESYEIHFSGIVVPYHHTGAIDYCRVAESDAFRGLDIIGVE